MTKASWVLIVVALISGMFGTGNLIIEKVWPDPGANEVYTALTTALEHQGRHLERISSRLTHLERLRMASGGTGSASVPLGTEELLSSPPVPPSGAASLRAVREPEEIREKVEFKRDVAPTKKKPWAQMQLPEFNDLKRK